MTAKTVVLFDEVAELAGKDLGYSERREIPQDQVNLFADATDDHQWIHTDPEKAADGPFGGPIAHGFLTLSLLIPMWSELFDVSDVKTKVNYGVDKVRFTSPVKGGRTHPVDRDHRGGLGGLGGQGQRPAPRGRCDD